MRRTEELQLDDEYLFEVDEERETSRKKRTGRKRRRSRFLLYLFLFALICAGIYLFLKSDYFLIKDIEVTGNNYYTKQEIIGMGKAKKDVNIIFDSGKNEIQETLEANPFFKEVKIKRRLPSTLQIEVVERPQIAAVEFGDSFIVIDDEGVILRRTDVDPRVTVITGLTISKMDVGEPIEAEEKETLGVTLRMLQTMQNGDIYFKKIDVSRVVIKAYIYDTLLVKGTATEVSAGVEAGNIQIIVSDLFSKSITRGTIKMGPSGTYSFTPDIEDGD